MITDTSLSFQWGRVPCGYRGGPNDFRYQLSDESNTIISEGDTSTLDVKIDNLLACNRYSFVVKAFNDAGEGDFADATLLETDKGGKHITRFIFIFVL